ncbi:hypothetical protein [Anoxybacteroides tepidamans]|uniref:hypothetical protein n=1 Tax=Anoxybacteroides tepidamans TaxID=265948 RepID=UPI000489F995|nr:hypothetical protein [Anoxybacillus tepidamans]
MFDPTAFDNLKTVIEGAIYDLDLENTLVVVDRRDLVDLAHFSRTYEIAFRLRADENAPILCKVTLEMELEQIARELLQESSQPGCALSIAFFMPVEQPETTCPLIEKTLLRIWGENRIIRQTLRRDHKESDWHNEIEVQFGRLIREENVDDVLAMVPYMLQSLQELRAF